MKGQPQEIELDIESLQEDGLGVAKLDDRTYHVRNALPGERVLARLLRRRKGVSYADGVSIEGQPHARRVGSSCAYFPRCGGCSFHHLAYEAGLEKKQSLLQDALSNHGIVADEFRAPVSTGRLGYRRKARLGVRKLGDNVLVGFRESFSNRVAKIDICQTLTPEISCLLKPLKQMLSELSIGDKVPQIEVAQGDNGVVLVIRHLLPLDGDDLQSVRAFERAHGIQILSQPGGYDTVATLDGGDVPLLDYALPEFGLHFEFDPRQFTQVNAAMNRTLVSHAIGRLQVEKDQTVADLFCGIGNFSLAIARQGARVVGYEADSSAIARAQANSQRNGLAHRTEFHVQDLYKSPIDDLACHSMLLDPPRSGAGELLKTWVTATHDQLQRIVYVSCNPLSFASDAALLSKLGYGLREVGVYDMFPQTAHVETLGVFVKRLPTHG
ncbi:MAG: 23S rRNA (uracil1939-C5)-methyltransferase [Limisphaerales bacterium]|jgi:23S rRNA (uracil1939-C5)-methyltransferase